MQLPEEALLRLSLTPGIGARTFAKLLAEFGSAEAALAAPPHSWHALAEVPARLLYLARSGAVTAAVERVRQQCEKLGLQILTLGNPPYPPSLAAIHDPPAVLYLRGSLPDMAAMNRAVAIVGTRKPSSHGLWFTRRLAAELSRKGAIVVSGLAVGIDAEAHKGVVSAGGVGIAVLPGGLDAVYPWINRGLATELCRSGCLLSESPPGSTLRRANFVARNRLISGLSRALVVIEAGEGSGALTTVEFAADQGRTVFVMPGRPGDQRMAGSLGLLRDGATILLSSSDLASELGLEMGSTERRAPRELGEAAPLLLAGGASLDAMASASGLAPPQLLAHLSRLEIDGRIRRASDGRYYLLDD